ncbi:MAG TPA: CPBP family intramembrane metalloprotease [Bacteroidia bacterium]|jgi:membrane protease YdiL (CAAX protease family)|nr:CPBP family intramembrane metalloprotease [Bacteroidia bacterium]
MFKNSIPGFFGFQILFFLCAYFFGNWVSAEGFSTWGLPFNKKVWLQLLIGVVFGIALYSTSLFLSIKLGSEQVTAVPDFLKIIKSSLPFAFGVIFTSLSEDILTRGIVFRLFHSKLNTISIVFISSTIYLLNHIYRLADGAETLTYLFLLGVIFVIPLIVTKRLWFTGAMHWAGNTFFFISHSVIETKSMAGIISPNHIFALCILAFIPIINIVSKNIPDYTD